MYYHGARPKNTYRVSLIPQGQAMLQKHHSAAGTTTTKNHMMLDKTNEQCATLLWDNNFNTVPGRVNMHHGIMSWDRNTDIIYNEEDDVFDRGYQQYLTLHCLEVVQATYIFRGPVIRRDSVSSTPLVTNGFP